MSEDNGKADFWRLFGWALVWLGLGGCIYLSHKDSKDPLINISIGANKSE